MFQINLDPRSASEAGLFLFKTRTIDGNLQYQICSTSDFNVFLGTYLKGTSPIPTSTYAHMMSKKFILKEKSHLSKHSPRRSMRQLQQHFATTNEVKILFIYGEYLL